MAESFNATDLSRVKRALFEYIGGCYNHKRPHTRIGNLSPGEFELAFPVQLDGGMGEAA
jgi:transposase InsO family protein